MSEEVERDPRTGRIVSMTPDHAREMQLKSAEARSQNALNQRRLLRMEDYESEISPILAILQRDFAAAGKTFRDTFGFEIDDREAAGAWLALLPNAIKIAAQQQARGVGEEEPDNTSNSGELALARVRAMLGERRGKLRPSAEDAEHDTGS